MSGTPLLEARGISKRFGGIDALKQVSFSLAAGEIHALVGENGAGKSTLVKILAGGLQPDCGAIFLSGKPTRIQDAHHGRSLGIAEIYQELMLVPGLTVCENIFLGSEHVKRFTRRIDRAFMAARSRQMLLSLGAAIDPRALVRTLTVAQQQMVEIARALVRENRVLILDEPTGSLTPKNAHDLFQLLHKLKEQGVGIIYISHRLEELPALADRVTVMRDGTIRGTHQMSAITIPDIIKLMVGREVTLVAPSMAPSSRTAPWLLEVRGISRAPHVKPVSFAAHAGEIVGFAGLVGAGRTELMRLLYGADRAAGGSVLLNGQPVHINSPADAVSLGLGLLPESRKEQGLVLRQPVRTNMTLPLLRRFTRRGRIDAVGEREAVSDQMRRLRIVAQSMDQPVGTLSGGNQQKVVIARWLLSQCRVLIFDEPTRGVDVGAKEEIYAILRALAGQGVLVLMVSSDLQEILALSSRIIVMCAGRITGELDRSGATEDGIMALMLGGHACGSNDN